MPRHVPTIADVAHPVRLRILATMGRGQYSPAQLSEQIGQVSLGTIAYHVRKLAEFGVLRQVAERPVRGAIEHFYAVTPAGAEAVTAAAALARSAEQAVHAGPARAVA